MGQNLVIVESPAKAKTISKYLGKNYIVEASMGHVRDLPKSKLGVDIEDNFTPKYITIRGKGELIDKLRKNKYVNNIINILEPILIVMILFVVTSYLIDNSYNPFLYFRF